MKLGEKSRVKIETFFREHFSDAGFVLPEIYFHSGRFTRIVTSALKIEGITVGKRIFILPASFWTSEKQNLRLDEGLVVHEVTHVLQYRRDGFFRFFRFYLTSYFAYLRRQKKWDAFARTEAYLQIPYEVEARENASRFVAWSRSRKN
ncbi:MAG: DUF4157 domain-containing protein [Acidobacteria bacterium]|nr:DUF4157 domain-containing protein [Acidobacteriota bacterium]